jgi:hypothetical protein
LLLFHERSEGEFRKALAHTSSPAAPMHIG